MENSKNCPICGKSISDFLKHLRFVHQIQDSEEFHDEITKLKTKKKRQLEFAQYVEELKLKKKMGDITAEEYRELITRWNYQHKV